jgi:hypothetical protein
VLSIFGAPQPSLALYAIFTIKCFGGGSTGCMGRKPLREREISTTTWQPLLLRPPGDGGGVVDILATSRPRSIHQLASEATAARWRWISLVPVCLGLLAVLVHHHLHQIALRLQADAAHQLRQAMRASHMRETNIRERLQRLRRCHHECRSTSRKGM